MTTLQFPLQIENGRLKSISGRSAISQMVEAITRIHPGELPLSRDYGFYIDYNIPLDVLRAISDSIKGTIEYWYDDIKVDEVNFVPDQDGTYVRIEVKVRDNG